MAKPFSYEEATAPQSSSFSYEDAIGEPAKPEGVIKGLGKSLKAGVQQIPGMVTGLADIPIALATGATPFSSAADALGKVTGFQPGKWAEETPRSAEYKAEQADVAGTWEGVNAVSADKSASNLDYWKQLAADAPDIAGAYARNPMYTANQVVQSVPGIVTGGVVSKLAKGVGAVAGKLLPAGAVGPVRQAAPGYVERLVGDKWVNPVVGAIGEGAVSAGTAMDNAQGEDQQKNALAALGAGVGTGLIGGIGGRIANSMGIETAATAMAKAGDGTLGGGLGATKRILGGAITEGAFQELPQSVQEAMWQNYADGKPIMEGVARQGVEGLLAGGVMGAGANVFNSKPIASLPNPPAAEPAAPAETPLQIGNTPDPYLSFPDGTVARRSEIDAYINALPPDQQPAARAKVMGLAPQPVKPSEAMGLNPAAGPLSTAATIAVDTGVHEGIQLQEANAADQAAYEQATSKQAQQAQQQDSIDKPITSGPIAEAAMSDEDKRAILFSNQPVGDGGIKYKGTRDGDILNGMGKPYPTRFAAQRRARMEGKDWTIAQVQDGFVARRKDSNGTTDATPAVPTNSAPVRPTDTAGTVGTGTVPDAGPATDAVRANPDDMVPATGLPNGLPDGALNEQNPQTPTNPAPVEAPGKAPQAVAGNAATATGLPAKGAGTLEADGVKEPWQITRADYAKQGGNISHSAPKGAGSHRDAVDAAVARGEKISPEVLKDYPWIAADENIKPYAEGLRGLTDKELSAEEKRASAELNKWAKDTPTINQDGGKLNINPELRTVKSFEVSARFNAVGNEIDRRKDDPNSTPTASVAGNITTQAPALDRIAAGKAWFGNGLKAQQFIAQNGLKDTHQAVKTSATRWDVRAKVSQPQGSQNVATPVIALEAEKERSKTPESRPAAVAPKKTPLKQRIEQARQARADYFTPGNIVQGYSGHDRVISYKAPDDKGEGWNVTVQAVVKQDGKWVVDPKDNRVRTHSTHPDARELAKGPVEKAQKQEQAQPDTKPERYKGHSIYSPVDGGFMARDLVGKNFGDFVAGPFQTREMARAAVDAQALKAEPAPTAKAEQPAQPVDAPDDGIVIKQGKGFIKDKFLSEVDGDGVPGGPFDTEAAARTAAEEWRAKKADRATESAAERARRDAMAEKIKAGTEPTAGEIKSLDLAAGESDIRWFFPTAANLFGLTSRQIRPLVADVIRVGQNDMGTKRELVPTKKALMAIGKALSSPMDSAVEAKPDAQPAAQEPAQADKPAAKIDDFGEKLLGARKDYAAIMKDAGAVDITAEPLSKSWPEPDYQKLMDGGVDPFVVAWVHASRDEIPTKPQSSWKVSTWAAQVKLLRDVSFKLLNGETTQEKLTEMLGREEFKRVREHVGSRAELYQEVGHEKSLKGMTFLEHHYSLYKGEKNVRKWVIEQPSKATAFGNWPREIVSANTRDEALNEFKQKYASLDLGKAKAKPGFIIYRKRGTDGAFVGKKIGREYIDLHKAADVKAARDYLDKNADALEALLAKYKDTPYERNEENAPRVGGDHRNGAPVTPEVFSDTFGFRGVQFGNYVEQGRRQSDLNEAFDALMDMAAVLGIPPRAISLNGRLGLAFGARGKGGKNAPAAHYEAGNMVINLTKGGGPGSLAHEWFHSADNYFAQLDGGEGGFITGGANGDKLRAEMRSAFIAIKRAINLGALKIRSEELDKRRSKPYWATPIEMAARSFESYIIAKLQDQNASNDYLANIVSQQAWDVSDAMRLGDFSEQGPASSYPYPTVDEMPAIRAAFDDFFKTVQTKETDQGVAMFSRGNDAAGQNALQALSENDELFALPKSDKDTVEGIAADTDPDIKVTQSKFPGLVKTYVLTLPDGGRARLMVRAVNPYGPQSYGVNTSEDGETNAPILERPGNNAEAVPDDTENVYIDVSALKEGKDGGKIYNIAATFAHNTGRILIGDPAGLSDAAMRRRTEHMLSSALKFGTTQHLAPHPRQVDGASSIGVPPLRWTYGDDLGNIKSLIQTSLDSLDHAGAPLLTFDLPTGTFRDSAGGVLDERAIRSTVESGRRPAGRAGVTTYKRSAVLRALVREESSKSSDGEQGAGVLAQLVDVGRQFPSAGQKIFYSRGALTEFSPAAQTQATQSVEKLVNAIAANWDNAPEIIVAFDMQDARIPERVRQEDLKQRSGGATGTPEGFYYAGKVYLMSSQITTPNDVARVLFHEALGHAGLRGAFGGALKPILQQIVTFRRADVEAKIKEYGLRSVNNLDRLTAAEEVLAEMAQTKPEMGFVKRAIAAIRSWLRANVPGFQSMKMTDADIIANFILPARAFVERGGDGPNGGQRSPVTGASSTVASFSRSISATLNDAANNVRGVKLPAGYLVGDLIDSTPGKLNWWHKTVGTQYNLSRRSKPFKRVFDAVQNFINDVSYFATEAADLAPNILPKLETWKDIAKSPLSAADTKAISTPIFEGTLVWARDESGKAVRIETLEAAAAKLTPEQKAQRLLRGNHVSEQVMKMWQGLPIDQYETIINGKYERDMLKAGVVFTDAELKSMFKLTDAQIPLYREFRAATDKSLTNLAIADMLRFGGDDVAPVRDAVLESTNVSDAADTLAKYLRSLANMDPSRSAVLMDTADKMIDKGDKAADLIKRGYAPLSRFGQYTLDVVDENGERVYFGMFENRFEAAKMNRQMREQFPGATISQGTVSEQAYKLFAGVTPETLELFGDMLGLEASGDGAANEAFQTYLKLSKSSRSAMKRLIQRKGIAGFNEDAGRVLAGFVYSNARQTASSLHMGEMTKAASDKEAFGRQGELQDAAVKLVDYIKNPQEEAQAFRGLLFAQYIGGSVASAMVNMTQPLTMTFPWLSQFGGVASAAKQMTAAIKDSGKKLTGNVQLDAALKRAEEDGTVSPQEVHQLMQQAGGRGVLKSGDGTTAGNAMATANNTLSRITLAWGKLFSTAEQFNRRVTFIAAYRTAIDQGMKDPDTFARRAVNETQGIYNKGNKPAFGRGAIGGTLMTFKQYSISYVEMLQRMSKNGPEGKKATLLALGVLFLLSGAGGMPGADDLDDLISGALQSMGYNFDSQSKRQAFFVELFGEGGAQFMERGVSGLPGVPIDVSGRMGLGNLLPGTGLFTKKLDHTRDVAEFTGPAGDLIKRGFDAAGKLITGEVGGAIKSIAPKALQNAEQSFDMMNMGMYRDKSGKKVLDTDGYDAMMKLIGFQPNDVKRVQDASFEVQRMIGLNRINESEIANKWALGLFEKNPAKVQEARDELAAWNEANPESRIVIRFNQIMKRVSNMNQTKAERIAKTSPKEIRAAVRQELEAAR